MVEELALGTRVRTTGGAWIGWECTVTRAYTIRFGHPMYDVTSKYGTVLTYLGQGQLEVLEDQEVI